MKLDTAPARPEAHSLMRSSWEKKRFLGFASFYFMFFFQQNQKRQCWSEWPITIKIRKSSLSSSNIVTVGFLEKFISQSSFQYLFACKCRRVTQKIRSGLLPVFFEDYTITHVKAVTAFTTRTFNSFSSVNFYPYASIYFGILDFMDDDMYYIYILHILQIVLSQWKVYLNWNFDETNENKNSSS